MAIASQKDFVSGLMFMTVGGSFAWGAVDYEIGEAARMGPGYFPFMLGLLLVFLGALPILIHFSLLFSKIASLLYYGTRYEDPISGKTYRKSLPYGYSGRAKRKNVLCPVSLSLERHRYYGCI